MTFLSFILSLCTTIRTKISVLINLFFLFVQDHSTKVRGHSSATIIPLYFVYYIHKGLLLYFVRYINGYMKSQPFREFSHFYPCFVIRKFFHAMNVFISKIFLSRNFFIFVTYLKSSDFFLAKVSTFKVYLRPLAKAIELQSLAITYCSSEALWLSVYI